MVVGPDEPYDDRSEEDMATAHFHQLAAVLAEHGVQTSSHHLRQLPHEVEISGRLLDRTAGRS